MRVYMFAYSFEKLYIFHIVSLLHGFHNLYTWFWTYLFPSFYPTIWFFLRESPRCQPAIFLIYIHEDYTLILLYVSMFAHLSYHKKQSHLGSEYYLNRTIFRRLQCFLHVSLICIWFEVVVKNFLAVHFSKRFSHDVNEKPVLVFYVPRQWIWKSTYN